MAHHAEDLNAEQMPVIDRMDKEYKIFVDNLPPELNEDAIKDVFGKYGKITGMFYRCNAKWTYITYGTYREAELAIRELNGKKPLNLKVALAKDRSFKEDSVKVNTLYKMDDWKENQSEAINNTTNVICNIEDYEGYEHKSIGRGQLLGAIHKHMAKPQVTTLCKYENESQFLPSCSQISNAYDNEGPYANTNALWTRGVMTVTSDGKRHVGLGRGYTQYEIPDDNPNIEKHIRKLHENRKLGLYEYGIDKFNNQIQKCCFCLNKTTKHCEKCFTYYCSRTCQIADWPRHQAECQRIPALVDGTIHDISILQINKDENTAIPNTAVKTTTSDNVKLRRPNVSLQESLNSSDICANMNKSSIDQPIKDTLGGTFSQQNQLHKHNQTNDIVNQSKKSDALNSTYESYNYQRKSFDNSPVKEQVDNNISNRVVYNSDRRHFNQRKEFLKDTKKPASFCESKFENKENSSTPINSSMVNDDIICKEMYLSKTKFTRVEVVIPLSNNEYWIYKVEDADERVSLMTELQDIAINSNNVKPVIGNIYGVMYETIWHRAIILSVNPIMVHFIDFGNNEILEYNAEIKDICQLCNIPKYARKIRLIQAENENKIDLIYGDNISVKMLYLDTDETIVVELEGQTDNSLSCSTTNVIQSSGISNTNIMPVIQENVKVSQNTNAKASIIQLPSVLDTFNDLLTQKAVSEMEVVGIMQIHGNIKKDIYNASLFSNIFSSNAEKILNDLPLICKNMQDSTSYKPQIGDLICGKAKTADWYRGYVLTVSPDLNIAAIDEARILSVDKVLPYPKEFLDICSFGVICETTGELKLGEVYTFTTVIRKKDKIKESLEIEIMEESETQAIKPIKAKIKPWDPTLTSSIPAFAELRSGSKICLTSYRSHYMMFARSLDDADVEYYNNIMQRVAQCAQKASHLTNTPSVGQMVIAPYCDGNNYRAMVTKMENNVTTIVYVDFGNLETVDVQEFKVLSSDLIMQRSCAAKIVLKDVPRDIPMTKEVDDYLRDLVGREIPLTCVYDDKPFKDGVYLTTSTGENVNNKIKRLLNPSWKQDNYDDKTCYMINDIDVASLGHVGDTVDALVLFIQEHGMKYMMSPIDIDLMTHVTTVMPTLLKEFCETTEYYIPRAQELCIALYEGAWYRALCLNPREQQGASQIFFIDYGNIEMIEHVNIRLMPRDFVTPSAIANMCTVVNLAPIDKEGNYSSIVRENLAKMISVETTVKIKIVECPESGDYKIELPDIHAMLIEQNLISS